MISYHDESTMQLYILGPAFGLPSIDAECNAAVALLQLRVPERYTVIPTHHRATRLPCLIDGKTRIWGYNSIARHLADEQISTERETLSAVRRADTIATTAFLEAKAGHLLDVSFYVSFENYRNATRPAFTALLPWHTNYILPPQRRAAARARTAHLGVATSIDVDDVHGDLSDRPAGTETGGASNPKEKAFAEATQQRASLLLPKKDTLKGLLKKPEHAAIFKLNVLVDDVLQPLQDLLGEDGKEGEGEETFLLGVREPHALDCLAVGYLSLMLYPTLPHSWLAARLRAKYPRLVSYTDRLRQRLDLHADTAEIMALQKSDPSSAKKLSSTLPFSAPESSASVIERLREISFAVLDTLPAPLHHFFPSISTSTLHLQHEPEWPFSWVTYLTQPTILLPFVTAAALAVTLGFRRGVLVWPTGAPAQIFLSRRARLPDFLNVFGTQFGVTGGFGR
jgi:sorting and assembly machinery component 37